MENNTLICPLFLFLFKISTAVILLSHSLTSLPTTFWVNFVGIKTFNSKGELRPTFFSWENKWAGWELAKSPSIGRWLHVGLSCLTGQGGEKSQPPRSACRTSPLLVPRNSGESILPSSFRAICAISGNHTEDLSTYLYLDF